MAVTKEIKRLEKSNVSLSVTVPKEDVRAQYNKMLDEYGKSLQIPGFRKGKVPKEVLERKFAEALQGDALGRIIESALQEVFKEEMPRDQRPLPYSSPQIKEEPKFDLDSDLVFSVFYDVLPEIKVDKWKGYKVDYPHAEVTDADVNRELDEIRERNAIVMDRDDNASAQKGDVVTIDYQIFEEDGQTPSEMNRKDFVFTTGANNNVYKFDDDIVGMKKGETKEFKKKFEKDHVEKTLAGNTRKVQIKLTSLKEKKLPDLDDDLAQDVDEKFKTLADLKNSIREKLNKHLEWRLKEKKISELLKKIMEDTPVVLPESMVRAELEGRWRRLAQYYNTGPEAIMQMMAGSEKENEWRETAQRALHSRIIIETLIEDQKIEVTDEEVQKEFEKIAAENSVDLEEVKKHYNEQAVINLKEELKEQKIIDILLAENSLKPGKKENYLDFMTDNG